MTENADTTPPTDGTGAKKPAAKKPAAKKPAAKKPAAKKPAAKKPAATKPAATKAPAKDSPEIETAAATASAPVASEPPAPPAPRATPASTAPPAPQPAPAARGPQVPPPPSTAVGAPVAPSPAPGYQPMLESEARNMAMLIHILAAVAVVLSAGTLAFLVPLVMWLIYRDRSALVDHHGKQNLNLQLTSLVVSIGGVVLGFITLGFGFLVTLPLMIAYWIYVIVISIVAGLAANRGEYYRIPVIIPFIR